MKTQSFQAMFIRNFDFTFVFRFYRFQEFVMSPHANVCNHMHPRIGETVFISSPSGDHQISYAGIAVAFQYFLVISKLGIHP